MNSKTVLLAALCLLLGPEAHAQTTEPIHLSPEAKKNIQLELASAEVRDIHKILEVRGMLREQKDRMVWITPTAKGQIARIFVKEPDKVKRGDVLMTLYCPELEKLRTELVKGTERLKLLEAEVARARSLVEKKILAARDLLRAETEHSLALAEVNATRRAIFLLGMTEEELAHLLDHPEKPAYLPVHATISGHVTYRDAYQGEYVTTDRKLLLIMDTSILWAEGDIFERDVPHVKVGQKVFLVLRPFKSWRAEGVIKAVSADMAAAKRTAHLWIEVPNPDYRLKPQMAVDISILLEKTEHALSVPKEAVLSDRGETFVFVANGDAFLRQRVVVGAKDHLYYEIRDGLYEGDRVVTKGNHELKIATSSQAAPVGSDGHLHQH